MVKIFPKLGTRKTFTYCGLISAVATLLTPISANMGFYYLCAMRFFQGLALATSFPSLCSVTAHWSSSKDSGMFISLLSVHVQLGLIFNMPASGAFCTSSLGWKGIYYLQGVLTLISFLIFYGFYRDTPHIHRIAHSTLLALRPFCTKVGLISPCECQGYREFIHLKCLEVIIESNSYYEDKICPICQVPFATTWIGFKPIEIGWPSTTTISKIHFPLRFNVLHMCFWMCRQKILDPILHNSFTRMVMSTLFNQRTLEDPYWFNGIESALRSLDWYLWLIVGAIPVLIVVIDSISTYGWTSRSRHLAKYGSFEEPLPTLVLVFSAICSQFVITMILAIYAILWLILMSTLG